MSAGTLAEPEAIELDDRAACATPGEASAPRASGSRITLAAAVLGFFVITLDAVVVNVALPSIRRDFGAGFTGLQWVADPYTLMFAALLLWSGALADRAGARRVFAFGLGLFVAASAACGLASSGPVLGGVLTLISWRLISSSTCPSVPLRCCWWHGSARRLGGECRSTGSDR